jgi:hypothetical protein
MIRGYFDESYRDKKVYAIGGYVGRDKSWKDISRLWRNRRLRDGVQCFHATDCEGGHGEFEGISLETRKNLKADLVQLVNAHEDLGGFASAVLIEDYFKVRESSERAKEILGNSPYFLCFQSVLSHICTALDRLEASPNVSVAYVFEEQEELSGRTKKLYDLFKKTNPQYAPRLGTLAYASKIRFVPLEIADNLAYETMKDILNRTFDPQRPRRIAMDKMRARIRKISLWREQDLQNLVIQGRTSKELGIG